MTLVVMIGFFVHVCETSLFSVTLFFLQEYNPSTEAGPRRSSNSF